GVELELGQLPHRRSPRRAWGSCPGCSSTGPPPGIRSAAPTPAISRAPTSVKGHPRPPLVPSRRPPRPPVVPRRDPAAVLRRRGPGRKRRRHEGPAPRLPRAFFIAAFACFAVLTLGALAIAVQRAELA